MVVNMNYIHNMLDNILRSERHSSMLRHFWPNVSTYTLKNEVQLWAPGQRGKNSPAGLGESLRRRLDCCSGSPSGFAGGGAHTGDLVPGLVMLKSIVFGDCQTELLG